MIRFLIRCHILYFRMLLFLVIYFLTFISKTGSLQHVSDKVLRARWPHWTYGNIMFLSKSGSIIGFVTKTCISPPPLLFPCLINSFYRRYVFSMYSRSNRSRSNVSNKFNRYSTLDSFKVKTFNLIVKSS